MLYRPFGNTGEQLSILGFGCMRLPVMDGNMARIDEEKATALIRHAIDQGVNYVDTAWSYHSAIMGQKGESEPFVGKVLQNDYRQKVNIATKLPPWLVNSRRDMDDILDAQLERLQTDVIDFYLVHSLSSVTWQRLKELSVTDFLDKAIRDGKVRYAGFSFHDTNNIFKEIVDGYDWSFCQIQYNYLDVNYQAGKEGMQYAAAKGLGVIAMEPLRGGKLASGIPDDVAALFREANPERSPAQWALRWVWNHPEIAVVLSGMNDIEQVRQNLEAAREAIPGQLTTEESEVISQAKELYGRRIKVNCTTCGYCMPCPNGVNIPGNFGYYNDFHLFPSEGARKNTSFLYNTYMKPAERPSACIECGLCEEKCPQGISIIEELKKVTETFG